MNLEKRIALILLICIPSIGCDQVTKSVASDSLSREFMTSYLFDIVRIGYTENQGAFLGLGSSMTAEFRFWLLRAPLLITCDLWLTGELRVKASF